MIEVCKRNRPIYIFHVVTCKCAISSQSSFVDPLDHPHWSDTLLQPSVDSSLKITNRSFRHAVPHLWNKLPPTLHVPYQLDHSSSPSSSPSSYSDPEALVDLSGGVFHSRLQTFLFVKAFFLSRLFLPEADRES